jgi:polyvinyl alcohol dehydrogenase (cytochrome)
VTPRTLSTPQTPLNRANVYAVTSRVAAAALPALQASIGRLAVTLPRIIARIMRAVTLTLTSVFLVGFAAFANAQDGAALYTQHCASCHDSGARAPSRAIISGLPADRIVSSLTSGLMRSQGQSLSADERSAVAKFLSSAAPAAPTASSIAAPKCDAAGKPTATDRDWGAWGVTLANERFQRTPGFTAAQAADLKLRWAFGFEGEQSAAANPTINGG